MTSSSSMLHPSSAPAGTSVAETMLVVLVRRMMRRTRLVGRGSPFCPRPRCRPTRCEVPSASSASNGTAASSSISI
eukprot:scaffold4312_cov101-Isochrysis_galbana.AAC.3